MSYQFQGQRPGEEVVLVTHQHPLVLLPRLWLVFVLLLLPLAVFAFIGFGSVTWLASVICWPVALVILINQLFGWYITLLLISSERILFIEQRGFFKRELVECTLASVQQVSHAVTGPLATIAGFGDLSISTSGSLHPIRIPHIPNPYAVQQLMLSVQRGEVRSEFFDASED